MGDRKRLFERKEFIICLLFAIWVAVSVIADDATAVASSRGQGNTDCPPNEYYKACMQNCSNCELRGKCPFMDCTKGGCDCIPHFVRLTPDGPCEPIRKCPKPTCQENEVFRPCGPVCETCSRLRCQVYSFDYRCYCKEGYLRNNEGKCIPENDCPPRTRCSVGEEQGKSGLIDEYCFHEKGVEASNETENKERCYCMEGNKRNLMGHCADEIICEFMKCRHEEIYLRCPPKCNTTCFNYGDPDCEEDGQCYPGCFCKNGQVMDDHKKCVNISDCPPGSNPLAPTAAPTTLWTSTVLPTDETTSPMTSQGTTPTQDQGTTDAKPDTTGTTPGISTNPGSTTTRKPKRTKPTKSSLPQKDKVEDEMAKMKKFSLTTPNFEEQNL